MMRLAERVPQLKGGLRPFFSLLLLLAASVLLVVAVPQAREPLSRLTQTLDASDQTSQTRINTWLEAWGYIRERPLTGYGFSAWEVISEAYNQPNSLLPRIIDGKSVPNIFLENWLSGGILALLMTLTLICYYSWLLIRLMRQRTNRWHSVLAEAFLCGWIVLVVSSIFTNAFKHNYFWIVVGLIAMLLMQPLWKGSQKNENIDGEPLLNS